MKRTHFHRFTVWVVVLAMLFSAVPASILPVTAASPAKGGYSYGIRVKNSNVKRAGTDNDISCLVETIYGTTMSFKIDSKANDFERNDDRTYWFNMEIQPWEIKKVGLKHSGGIDAVRIDYFEFILPGNGGRVYQSVDRWFEKQEQKYNIWGSVDRQIKSRGNFDSQFSGTKYFDPDTTSGQSNIVMEWDGLVTDQYFDSAYNMFDYAGAVGVTFEVSGKTQGGDSSINSIYGITENNLGKVESKDGFDNKLTLYTNDLLSYMKNNKIYKLTITATLDYNFNTDEYDSHSETYTIYRTGFGLGNASAVTAAYVPEVNGKVEVKDNYFYNSNPLYKTFEIKVPVKNYDNYTASAIASTLASNIKSRTSEARVYYDKTSTSGYVEPKNAYSSGSNVYLVCDVPATYANSEGLGLTVVINNGQAVCNSKGYKYDSGNYSFYISTHKVDTKGLTHVLKDSSGNDIDGFDTYAKQHTFKLSFDGENDVYIHGGEKGRVEGSFSYRLYDKSGREITLTKYRGKNTYLVPWTSDSVYTIVPAKNIEGEYILKISSRDFANNLEETEYPVKLDMIAPRASYSVAQKSLDDGSKRNEYTFNITDASGTGRLYYVFVRDGQTVPDDSQTKPETSGPEDTVFEKWGFINQANSSANTIVLEVAEGGYFDGKLYWYTVDDAGNTSKVNGYNYIDIELNNVKTECELIIDNPTRGRSSYDIKFETNSNNTIKYRWVGESLTTPYFTYTESSDPGAASQLNGSGKYVTLDGDYTLEYIVTGPDGSYNKYTREFFFDNTVPKITMTLSDSKVSDTETVSVTVKDVSNIETIQYRILTADGDEVISSGTLPAGLPVVANDVFVAPADTGAYKVEVTAVDINGQSATAYSSIFSIRTSAPEIHTVESDIESEIDGVPITSSQDYIINLKFVEYVGSIKYFDATQQLYYRTSVDGTNWSDWANQAVIKESVGSEAFVSEFQIYSPWALTTGDNIIYVQAAIASNGTDADTISDDLIVRNSDLHIIYDDTAPQYKLTMGEHKVTKEDVKGTIVFSDDISAPDKLKIKSDSGYVLVEDIVFSDNSASAAIVVTGNVDGASITITDEAGNEIVIPITVDCIDKTSPWIYTAYKEVRYAGDREDNYISFRVDGAVEANTSYYIVDGEGIIPDGYFDNVEPGSTQRPSGIELFDADDVDDEDFGPLPENIKLLEQTIDNEYDDGESDVSYKFLFYADEEVLPEGEKPDETDTEAYNAWMKEWEKLNLKKYFIAVRSEDDAGNVSKQTIALAEVKNTTAKITGVYASPEKAYNKTALILDMSVPVYVLPEDKIPQNIKIMENIPDGRIDTSDNTLVAAFAEELYSNAPYYSENFAYVVSGIGEKAVYFTDETGRVYKQTVTVKDISEKGNGEDDGLTAYVSFGNEAPVKASIYRVNANAYYNTWDELVENSEKINVEDFKAFDYRSAYHYVVIEPTEQNVTLSVEYVNTADYDFYSTDFTTDTRLVYELGDSENLDRVIAYTATVSNENITDTVGGILELKLDDVTTPEVDVSYSNMGYTNSSVTANIFAYDTQLAVNTDGSADTDESEETELKVFTKAEIAQQAGIANISITGVLSTYPDVGDYDTLTYTDLGQVSEVSLTFEENGYAVVKVTNTAGLVTYKLIEVQNINKSDIVEGEEGDYVLNYYYYSEVQGEFVLVEANSYYKEVYAEIELTANGENRYIEVTNNLGSFSKMLTAYDDSFTFTLMDRFGNTKNVDVSFDKFDTEGPIITYELATTEKTNQSVSVSVYVTDIHTAVKSVTAESVATGEGVSVTYDSEVTDADTEIVTQKYILTAEDSGRYTITATDIRGNETVRNFDITNIDKTVPSIAKQVATTTERTRQTVGVKLYFSKPNVVIQKVEIAGGTALKASDVVVDYTTSTIRFNENGTVSVWFVDEWGNVGSDVVTVDFIDRKSPALKANVEVAPDLLSVYVTFEETEEETRDLSDFHVMYGGTTPVHIETDENGNILSTTVIDASECVFELMDNGEYTFYAYDAIGNIQEIDVTVTEIDRTAPVITKVAWTYKYLDENGVEQTAVYTITPGTEAGYNIVEDDTYRGTNRDITATVTTDVGTKFAGSQTDEYTTEHSIVYDKDGWFNFDMVKPNDLKDSYGLGLYVIDKEAPVIEEVEDLIFFENPNAGTAYDESLLKYKAYDERYGEITDLTANVEIDWGGFLYKNDEFANNVFDKNKPYTITYKVKDAVGNETVVKRKITLVGLFDTTMRVNGNYPDSSGRVEVVGDTVELQLDNFSGTAYARYEEGIHTMGEMKAIGTVIEETNGKFVLSGLTDGWYTFYVQTDLRDYFCVSVYVYNE